MTAPGTAQGHQRKGGVRACNEKINRRVIQFLEDKFRPTSQAVIQRRQGVQQEQASAINTETDNLPGVALQGGEYHQYHQRSKGQGSTNELADTVKVFTGIHRRIITLAEAGKQKNLANTAATCIPKPDINGFDL